MAQSEAQTPEEYLAQLPPGRREALAEVRAAILRHLPEGYEEMMLFGMISYVVPLTTFANTYNKKPLMYAALASQRNYMSLYLMCVYGDSGSDLWSRERYRATGKKLDMGKSCVRFKSLHDLPMDLIAETIARTPLKSYLEQYEASRRQPHRPKA